jgi:hypothetical protein
MAEVPELQEQIPALRASVPSIMMRSYLGARY